jgi:hypothetical protein
VRHIPVKTPEWDCFLQTDNLIQVRDCVVHALVPDERGNFDRMLGRHIKFVSLRFCDIVAADFL